METIVGLFIFTSILSFVMFWRANNKYKNLIEQYSKSDQNYQDLTKEHSELNLDYRSLDQKHGELNSNHKDLKHQHDKLNSDYRDLSHRHSNLHSDYNRLDDRYTKLDSNYNRLDKKHKTLVDNHWNLSERYYNTELLIKQTITSLNQNLGNFGYQIEQPIYDFGTSEEYKNRLLEIRNEQKSIAKEYKACWIFDSDSDIKPIEYEIRNLMVRAFNSECTAVVSKVTYRNIETSSKKINSIFTSLNKIGENLSCQITSNYLSLKLDELYLVYEYKEKLEEEKELRRQEKEILKDQLRAQKELEKAQAESDKEEKLYQDALEKARKELEKTISQNKSESEEQRKELEDQIASLSGQLKEAQEKKERATSQAQLTRAGYVYIISNIGSFGEDVYKVGLTRRLDPFERVKELGGASVPFRFDIHAMIYSEDAPTLENLIHDHLKDNSVNRVNTRKEFFNVSLNEIKEIIKDADQDIRFLPLSENLEFVEMPEAEEYRKTLSLLAKSNENEVREEV